jgi:hypothetical protein
MWLQCDESPQLEYLLQTYCGLTNSFILTIAKKNRTRIASVSESTRTPVNGVSNSGKNFQGNRIIVEYHRRDQRWEVQEIQNNRQPRKMDKYAGVYEILLSFTLE